MTQATLFPISYHNTVPLSGQQLQKAEAEAVRQEDEVLALFQRHRRLTPWQAEARLNASGRKWPITSIRRAITNLTGSGQLKKTGDKISGPLGHIENVWEAVK